MEPQLRHKHGSHAHNINVILYFFKFFFKYFFKFGKWVVCADVVHKSQNKSQLVLVVLVLNKLKHNLIQLGK